MTLWAATLLLTACGGKPTSTANEDEATTLAPCPEFNADSAMQSIVQQCDFGPRVTGSKAWQQCGDWICQEFERRGCTVEEQHGWAQTWDGSRIKVRNITARYRPELSQRVMLCSHWDSRPWADNDEDEANHHTPVPAANDGASGVAVMLEVARLLHEADTIMDSGVDFVCFDAEDMGTPMWANEEREGDTWCLGSQLWSIRMAEQEEKPKYGILLDMVGGYGATFSMESVSMQNARPLVERVWRLAAKLGYGHYFPMREGGGVTDDHVYVNSAGIPCIDIIPYHEYGRSVFGHTWHTLQDTPQNIDPKVLKAVGQTMVQLICDEAQ